MANFKIPHPWDAGYAIPDYIRAEPPGRAGAMTTLQLPRGTMGHTPKGWNGGFAVPGYIMNEPHRRGAIATQQMRRRTIPSFIPDALGADKVDYEFGEMDLRKPIKKSGPAIPPWALPAAAAVGVAILIFMKVKS